MPFVEREQVIEEKKKSPILRVPILSYLPKKKKKIKQLKTKPPLVDIVTLYILYNRKEN